MRTVQDQFGLKREEFPEKLETFDEALVATLGKGATSVERLILKRLYAELGIDEFPTSPEDFATRVRRVEAYYLTPERKRKRLNRRPR